MSRVYSNERTKLAYDGQPEVNGPVDRGMPDRVVLDHGVNVLTDGQKHLLMRDGNFKKHVMAGVMVIMPDEDQPEQQPDEDQPEQQPEPVAEKAPAPVKGKPAALPPTKEVEDFFGLAPADRAAMYPALPPEVKALVDADPRSKAVS